MEGDYEVVHSYQKASQDLFRLGRLPSVLKDICLRLSLGSFYIILNTCLLHKKSSFIALGLEGKYTHIKFFR